MRRRNLIRGFAMLLPLLSCGQAQAARKPVLIVMLGTGNPADTEKGRRSFESGLQELGYVQGHHYVIEGRSAEGVLSRLPLLAQELVSLGPNVVVASTSPAVLAVKQVTSDIPIVSPLFSDPVGLGLIANQARPGSNVTGILGPTDADLAGKQLALAREIVPSSARIGLLINSRNAANQVQRKGADTAAAALSIELASVDVQSPDDLDDAFKTLAGAGVGAVFVFGDSMLFAQRRRIAAAALSARLPTMFTLRENVADGGLSSYGIDLQENFRRSAHYVDRILKGAKPADLPVELPTKFEFVINLKTAKAIGLTLPESFLARADEVIE